MELIFVERPVSIPAILQSVTIEAEPRELSLAEFVTLRARIAKDGYRGLTEDERTDLLTRTKRKERRASELFVLLHDGFVFKVLKLDKYRKRGFANIDLEEAVQEGRLAVLRAVETYNPSSSSFSTYLSFWLKASTRKRNSGDPLIWIEPQKFVNGKYSKVDLAEVALVRNVVGLDDRIEDEDALTIAEKIDSDEPDPAVLYERCRTYTRTFATLQNALATLSKHEKTIVEMRWSKEDGATLEEVGNVFGLSRERIRQIEAKAFAKIRRHFQVAKVDPE